MTKVDFQVLCLQVGGSRKISEVQVRVCYYWFVIIGRGCLVLLKFKSSLCWRMLCLTLCKDYVVLALILLVLIRHSRALIVSEQENAFEAYTSASWKEGPAFFFIS